MSLGLYVHCVNRRDVSYGVFRRAVGQLVGAVAGIVPGTMAPCGDVFACPHGCMASSMHVSLVARLYCSVCAWVACCLGV